ncbi:hypothetical protein [Pseudarthrobacter oxydans]|uniref:hypothetical protein n=1 Tax=Pseudarthrobacter oxydans TaxID=1671 RepID=UPI0034347610
MAIDGVRDAWPTIDAEIRKRVLANGVRERSSLYDDVPGSTGPWRPARPLILDETAYGGLAATSERLMLLILEACRRRARSVGDLHRILGADLHPAPLLRPEALLAEDLLVSARPDILIERGVPRFVEINIDGSLGGTWQADTLAERHLEIVARAGLGDRVSAPASAVDARFAEIRRSLGLRDGAIVAIPVFSVGAAPGLDADDAFLDFLQPMCEAGRRHGLDTRACRFDDLTVDSTGRLQLGDDTVAAVLRLFLCHDQPKSSGLDALITAHQARSVQLHTPEDTWLLTDKTVLAWLWSDMDLLDVADAELIRRHIPRTVLLSDAIDDRGIDALVEERAKWVLKPGGGYGGDGVTLGVGSEPGPWRAELLGASEQGGFVLQEIVEADELAMEFVHLETAEQCTATVPFVLGPFLFGRTPSSVLVRHGVPGGSAILNAHRGASMSTALVLSDA